MTFCVGPEGFPGKEGAVSPVSSRLMTPASAAEAASESGAATVSAAVANAGLLVAVESVRLESVAVAVQVAAIASSTRARVVSLGMGSSFLLSRVVQPGGLTGLDRAIFRLKCPY